MSGTFPSNYFAKVPRLERQLEGSKGGKVKGKKGLAAMSPEKRKEIQAKALEAKRKKGMLKDEVPKV